jgi:pimeloyl-ACP methyl ester carboxylesterase
LSTASGASTCRCCGISTAYRRLGNRSGLAAPYPVYSRRQLAYVTDAYRDALLAQFPQARAHVIAGAGHWVHAEKPEAVLRAIRRYLTDTAN